MCPSSYGTILLKQPDNPQKGTDSCGREDRKFQILRNKLMPAFVELISKIFFIVMKALEKDMNKLNFNRLVVYFI